MTVARTPKGTAHTPTGRRSLSGKKVPLERPTAPWDRGGSRRPSRDAERRAFARLTPEQLLDHHAGTLDETVLAELAADEMTRHPANLRTHKRGFAKAMARKAKRGRRIAARSTVAAERFTPRPSRGFLRRLLADANRRHNEALAASMSAHPAGKKAAA